MRGRLKKEALRFDEFRARAGVLNPYQTIHDKFTKPGPSMCGVELPAHIFSTLVIAWSFGLLYVVWFAGMAPYHPDHIPAPGTIFDDKSSAGHVSTWGDHFIGPRIVNTMYDAGDPLSFALTPARFIANSFYVLGAPIFVWTWQSDEYESATKTVLNFGDDESLPSGKMASTNQPAMGRLQSFAQQFSHVEELAKKQTATACGVNSGANMFFGDANNTVTSNSNDVFRLGKSMPTGGWYCEFLSERADTVSLWYRTIQNCYRCGFWTLSIILYAYFFRVVVELSLWFMKPDYSKKDQTQTLQSDKDSPLGNAAMQIYIVYTTTCYGAESMFLEELLWTIVITCLLMVRVCVSETVSMAVANGPDLMGFKALNREGVAHMSIGSGYSEAGVHDGQVFYSTYIFDDAQWLCNFLIVLFILHMIVRAALYYPYGSFYNCSANKMNLYIYNLFGTVVPHHFGGSDQNKARQDAHKAQMLMYSPAHQSAKIPAHYALEYAATTPAGRRQALMNNPEEMSDHPEVANQPCTLFCFLPLICCNIKSWGCWKWGSNFLWFLRGSMRYSIFVFVTLAFAVVLTMFVSPAIYIDGLRSQYWDGLYVPGARTSLSLVGSRSEAGGYCLAEVLGSPGPDERDWTSARRNSYQDFTSDAYAKDSESPHKEALSRGMTFMMWKPLAGGRQSDEINTQSCSYCLDTNSQRNPRIPNSADTAYGTSQDAVAIEPLRLRMQRYAPNVMGMSVYLRYNAELADVVISHAMVYINWGFLIILAFVVLGLRFMRELAWRSLETKKDQQQIDQLGVKDTPRHRFLRTLNFFAMNMGEYIGHAAVIAGLLLVIFLAVRPAEITRDTLISISTSGVNYGAANDYINDPITGFLNDIVAPAQPIQKNFMHAVVSANNQQMPTTLAELNTAIVSVLGSDFTAANSVLQSTPNTFLHSAADFTPAQSGAGSGLANVYLLLEEFGRSTAWQRAISMGLASNSKCQPSNDVLTQPGEHCVLGTVSFFRDETITHFADGAENHEAKREWPNLVDSNWRSMCRPSPAFFYNEGDNTYSVTHDPRQVPEYQNDIRMWCIFLVGLSVAHLMMYALMFMPLSSFNWSRGMLDTALTQKFSFWLSDGVTNSEMTTLLSNTQNVNATSGGKNVSPYQPTILRMTGLPNTASTKRVN